MLQQQHPQDDLCRIASPAARTTLRPTLEESFLNRLDQLLVF
jgi:hypothetical protein